MDQPQVSTQADAPRLGGAFEPSTAPARRVRRKPPPPAPADTAPVKRASARAEHGRCFCGARTPVKPRSRSDHSRSSASSFGSSSTSPSSVVVSDACSADDDSDDEPQIYCSIACARQDAMQALVARQRFANNSTATPSTPVRKVDEKVAARNSRRASRARVLEHASRRITQRWAVLAADQVVHEKDEQEGSVDQKEEQQPQNRASLTAAQSAHWSLCLRLGLMGGSHYRRMGALPPPAYLDSDSDSEQEAEGEQEEGSHEESDGRREGAQARRARHARHRAMADLATMAAIESEEEREEEEKKEQKYAQASAESHPPLFAPVAVRSTGASPLSGHTPSGSVSSTNSSNSYSSGHESLFDAQEERHSVAGGRSRATTMSTHGGCVERTSKIDLELAKLDKELLETFDAFEFDEDFFDSEDELASYSPPLGWGEEGMDSSTNGGVRQSCAWSAGPGLDAAALNLVLDSPSSAASPPAYAAQATPSPSKDDALFFSNADSISVEPHDGEAAPRSVFECDSPPLESAPQSLGLNAGASAFANSISTFWRRGGSQPPSPTDAVPTLPKTGPSPSYHSTNVAGGDKLTRTEKAEVDKLVGRLDNVLRARWGQVKNALGSNPLAAQGSMSPARTTPRHRRTGAINAGSA